MLPPGRLMALTVQAVRAQRSAAEVLDNRPPERGSLLEDFRASLADLPTQCAQTLHEHGGPVWHVRFSADGARVATGCQDGHLLIWTVCVSTASSWQLLRSVPCAWPLRLHGCLMR